jgi:hypothetical protein
LIALLGIMIASAVLRMRLYVHYFGLTLDRFYPLVFMGWLVIVLAWLALTVLRGRGGSFVAGAVIAGLSMLALLNLVVPDTVVARVNVARARSGTAGTETTLDLSHLATLGGEAIPIAVSAVLGSPPVASTATDALAHARDRCTAATLLLRRWGPTSRALARTEMDDAAWRTRNAGEVEASVVVRSNHRGLLAVQHDACARERALSPNPAARRPSASGGR